MRLLMLLPPSEGKAPGGRGSWAPGTGTFAMLEAARSEVAAELAAAMSDDALAAKLVGLSSGAAASAVEANRGAVGGKVLRASERYTGVVWANLHEGLTSAAARRRAARSVVVLSGLLGAVSFADSVPLYKLKVGAALPGTGNLAAFWRPHVTAAVGGVHAGATSVDLLPAEHRRAIDLDAIDLRHRVEVSFLTAERRAVGHAAKAAKGRFAARLLEVGDPVVAARTFAWEGWSASVVERDRHRTHIEVSLRSAD
jgi:cytoplasmic iron level regulating protein YaaA (DUF328/UPF0246 family)